MDKLAPKEGTFDSFSSHHVLKKHMLPLNMQVFVFYNTMQFVLSVLICF